MFKRRADPLRMIALRLDLPELEALARAPGVMDCYRITVQYHDGRHPNQVMTLIFRQGGLVESNVYYLRPATTPLILSPRLPLERCKAFALALRTLKFDTLDDQDNIPWFGADLWMVERASGSFYHDIVIAPESAAGDHLAIVNLIQEQLREAIRAISN
jgi:hypothetical protein